MRKMKKSVMAYSLFVAVLMSGCAGQEENSVVGGTEKANLVVKLSLADATHVSKTRAAQSTAIPQTSWDNINQVQLFLYDGSNTVRFSDVVIPSASTTTFTYPDVPVGTYTVVAVANAKSSVDAVSTYLDGGTTPAEWTLWNVRQKQVQNLALKLKPGTFPDFCASGMAGKSAFTEPAEIFMGAATGVTVSATGTVTVPSITLKREVSLMRVRLNVKEAEGGTNNDNSAQGVDFAQDASIMIHRLPDLMTIEEGNSGGVSSASSVTNVLAISGGEVFHTADPSTGYSPSAILGGNFTMWRDIVVFPNNGGRHNNNAVTGVASAQQQYFVVVSGRAKAGHILADGTSLSSESTVYWSGVVKENFVPNVIREVNLTLRTGGTTTVPTNPTEYGGLTIEVSAPVPWDSNIVVSDIIL